MTFASILRSLLVITIGYWALGCSTNREPPPVPPPAAASPGAQEGTPLQAPSRAIARTFELRLRAPSPTALAEKLQSEADAQGGYVEKSDSQAEDLGTLSVTLELRIPSDKVATFLPHLRSLAEVVSMNQQTEEVTQQVVDTAARLRAKNALEQRLLELFARAHTIDEMLKVEAELARVRTEIEQLSASERGLQQRVSFVLLKLTVVPTEPVLAAREPTFGSRLASSFREAWRAAQSVLLGSIEVLGVLTPLALLASVVWFPFRWWWRRGKRLQSVTAGL